MQRADEHTLVEPAVWPDWSSELNDRECVTRLPWKAVDQHAIAYADDNPIVSLHFVNRLKLTNTVVSNELPVGAAAHHETA